MASERRNADGDENRDPISGEPGAHPVGVGLGAAGAGAAGAAIGMAAGPIGAAVGAVVGAVAGGLAGKGVAEAIDPTAEHSYWEKNYHTRPYVEQGTSYEEYRPAYQYGLDARTQHAGKTFDIVEPDLKSNWESVRGNSRLGWDKARGATRDAWDRIESRTNV